MIKILIADDHSIVRVGLIKILTQENDFEVTGEASNFKEVLSLLRTGLPDILLLDISMPGRNGLELLKEIKSLYKSKRVIIISMHPEDRFALRAIKSGAYGQVQLSLLFQHLV